MDRRKFLILTSGLSAIPVASIEAALSLDEVQSGMKQTNSQGRQVSAGTDFIKREQYIYNWYVQNITNKGLPEKNKITPVYKDANAQEALKNIYLPLTRSSTRSDLKWNIFLLDSPVLNAFTPGGGLTCVYTNLIKYCKTEAELASVLAHEIGHIEHKHAIRRLMANEILDQFQLSNNQKLIDLAYRLKQQGKNISMPDMMSISLEIFYKNFKRMWEHQADAFTLKAFVENDYDLSMASHFLKTLDALSGTKPEGTCLYSSHPDTIERISRINTIANTLSNNRRPRGDSDEFRYLKDRLGHINV